MGGETKPTPTPKPADTKPATPAPAAKPTATPEVQPPVEQTPAAPAPTPKPTPEKPSIGRVVHYVKTATPREVHLPAIIVSVGDGPLVQLTVFSDIGGTTINVQARQGTGAGTWHWPERV